MPVYTCFDCGVENHLKHPRQSSKPYRCRSCVAKKRWERDRIRPENTTYVCVDCGKDRTLKEPPQGKGRYRCRSCAAKQRWKRDRKYPAESTCAHCGASFPNNRSGPPNKFCSKECRIDAHTVTKTCPVCDEEFTVSKSTADRYNVCSMKCKRELQEWSACERCGTPFRHTGDKNTRRHCSEECRRPPHFAECRNCGEEFRVPPSSYQSESSGLFCSFRCYRAFSGESGIERITRKALEKWKVNFKQEYPIERPKGKPFLFDFYIPDGNLLIEVDGIYWHREANDRDTDARKTAYAEKKGYAVERIPEDVIRESPPSKWLLPVLKNNCVPVDERTRFAPEQLTLPFNKYQMVGRDTQN